MASMANETVDPIMRAARAVPGGGAPLISYGLIRAVDRTSEPWLRGGKRSN